MNHERYLFRGKRIDNGEWVYGSLCKVSNKCSFAMISVFETECSGYIYDVNSNTIGQYTGIKDKDGVKIFEGDIVHFVNPGFNFNLTAPVVFEHGDFCLEKNPSYLITMGNFEDSCFKIVGNKFDDKIKGSESISIRNSDIK